MNPNDETTQPKNRSLLKFLLFVLVLVACWYVGQQMGFNFEQYEDLLLGYPLFISGPIFIGTYIVTTFFIMFGPKDVLRISSAILFGPLISTIFVTVAEIGNACLLFGLSRTLGREWVAKKFGKKDKSIYDVERDISLMSVLALRVNPLVPFRWMDLGFGLTRISFVKYFLAVLIGTAPRVYWLQMIIHGVGKNIFKDYKAIYNYLLDHPYMIRMSVIYFGMVVVITLAALFSRFIRKKLDKRAENY